MGDYTPLTKIVIDRNGNEAVACAFYDTEQCQIHTCKSCADCKMFSSIMNQLNIFERIYME